MSVRIDGIKLRTCRESLNLSREDLATAADISVRYLGDLENGIYHNVGIEKLFPICAVLGISVCDVIIIHYNVN